MSRRLASLIVLTAALMTLTATVEGRGNKAVRPVINGAIAKKIDELLGKLDANNSGFYGSAIVAKKGKVLLWKSYGSQDPKSLKPIPLDALWDWASVTYPVIRESRTESSGRHGSGR